MNQAYFVFLFFVFGINLMLFGQNKKDQNGKKTGKWIFTGADRPESGIAKDGKVEEGYFVNGRKEGVWIKYHKDGKSIKLKGNYNNNRPDGEYKRYFKDEKLKESGSFSKDQFKGELIRYHANGKIAYQGSYNNSGTESGVIKYFHENGNVALEYTAKNNSLEGKITRYYEDGSVKESFVIQSNGKIQNVQKFEQKEKPKTEVNDKKEKSKVIYPPKIKNPNTKGVRFEPNGYNKIYNENDDIWMDGDFKNGQLWDGKVRDYDKNGILNKIRVFKKGVYHSDGQL
jgi:antitoxin component YwqK of YwqJK toxin-antitoxin module